jgi:BlaI family transcriptional regulator, penicillinase repressor
MERVNLTDRELDIMNVLWSLGSATVAEVRERLPDELAYTTVLTLMRILEQKGHVAHTKQGRAFQYRPVVERAEAGRSMLRRMTDKLFRGSSELLMAELVSDRSVTEEEIRAMRRLLDERLAAGQPGDEAADDTRQTHRRRAGWGPEPCPGPAEPEGTNP